MAPPYTPLTLPDLLGQSLPACRSGVAAIVYRAGQLECASLPGRRDFDVTTPVSIGCIAKPITATLMATAVADGKVSFEDAVSDRLHAAVAPHWTQISVHHLLSSTHGLDDSCMLRLPVTNDGWMDSVGMVESLVRHPPLAAPGVVYNYGSGGAGIAAALLEQLNKTPYTDQVLALLTRFQAAVAPSTPCLRACPATGGDMLLSAEQAMAFIDHHLQGAQTDAAYSAAIAELRGDLAFKPDGWNPVAQRMCLGWYDFGFGWYGCSGRGERGSMAVRFMPASRIALVVTSSCGERSGELASNVLERVFRLLCGNKVNRTIPRLLDSTQIASFDPQPFCGTYGNGSMVVIVDAMPDRSLRASVFRRSEADGLFADAYLKRRLLPAAERVFFANPPEPKMLGSVWFSHPFGGVEFGYMHTRVHALRRLSEP